jgi:L-lactate dehydrogenase
LKNQKTIRTVSTIINNWKYGIDDVALSLPAVIGSNGAEKIFDVDLSDKEIELLQYSSSQIKAFLENFKHML